MIRNPPQHIIHIAITDYIGSLYCYVICIFRKILNCLQNLRCLSLCLGSVMDQSNFIYFYGIFFPCTVGFYVIVLLQQSYINFFHVPVSICIFGRFFSFFDTHTAFLPDFMKIILNLLQWFSLPSGCIIYQNISVYVNALCLISQKNIIAVTSTQQVHFLIHNQIFVVHTIVYLKQIGWYHRIVNTHFHIVIWWQSLKITASSQKQLLINSIDQQLNLYASWRSTIQSSQKLCTILICT